jgi:hypothetical protein
MESDAEITKVAWSYEMQAAFNLASQTRGKYYGIPGNFAIFFERESIVVYNHVEGNIEAVWTVIFKFDSFTVEHKV